MSFLFPNTTPPDFLNIGRVLISFGCGDEVYLATFNNTAATAASNVAVFTDTAKPCYAGDSDPTNKAALDDLATQFGTDWLGWLAVQFDYVFAGIVNLQPNGFIDEIEFDYSGSTARTRIRSCPWNGWPTDLCHDDPGCRAGPPGGLLLGIATTDITAASGATYGFGTVQLYSAGFSAGTSLGAPVNVDNWFPTVVNSGSHLIVGKIGCVYFVVSAAC